MNFLTFWIIKRQACIVHYWFKRQRVPEKIRNRTVPKTVGNGLNLFSNDEEHGLPGTPTTGETYGVNTWISMPYFMASFPVMNKNSPVFVSIMWMLNIQLIGLICVNTHQLLHQYFQLHSNLYFVSFLSSYQCWWLPCHISLMIKQSM